MLYNWKNFPFSIVNYNKKYYNNNKEDKNLQEVKNEKIQINGSR